MNTISLCMIVKNEEKVLARCLDTIGDLADEIIIVDTGSSDRTKEIAARYTEKVNIYDYTWQDDFAAARNFAFSKAAMDYIYAADADEVLDDENRERFRQLKETLLPEIEIVQMWYVNCMEEGSSTTENYKKELRPKLYKRLRTFQWVDSVHESVNLQPVVYDSDIEILHMPQGNHGGRDIAIFQKITDRGESLSPKLHNMYARELLITGTEEEIRRALPYFERMSRESLTEDMGKESVCVLARGYRLLGKTNDFFKAALKDMATNPCAEICMELGEYFFALEDFDEAAIWYYNAAYETSAILYARAAGDLPRNALVQVYEKLMAETETLLAKTDASDKERKEVLSERHEAYAQAGKQHQEAARQWLWELE